MDTLNTEKIENDVLDYDVTDEALEIAAVSGDYLATRVTLAACTNIWSTFCNA